MYQYTIFCCDYCDFVSKNYQEIIDHEASHFDLTASEFIAYKHMISLATIYKEKIEINYFTPIISKNMIIEKYNNLVDEIIKFEQEHPKIEPKTTWVKFILQK